MNLRRTQRSHNTPNSSFSRNENGDQSREWGEGIWIVRRACSKSQHFEHVLGVRVQCDWGYPSVGSCEQGAKSMALSQWKKWGISMDLSGVRHVLATWLHPHVCHFLLSDLGHVTAALQSSFVFWKTKSVMLSFKDTGWFHKIMNVKFSKSCYECHLLFFLSLRQCCQNVCREQSPHPVHVHFGSIYQGTCFSLLGPRLQFRLIDTWHPAVLLGWPLP